MTLPTEILSLLKSENFCFLATSYQDHPHVSLMNFTYLEDEGLIIISSRRDTTKVSHIRKNPDVAVLLYNLGTEGKMPVSCTIYGTATEVSSDRSHLYREKHYKKHAHMGKFIVGENISVITIRINSTSLSDVEDRVRSWSIKT